MKRRLFVVLKFILACVGPGILLYSISLFDTYHALGANIKDTEHGVPLNNHGVVKYITESQYENFHFYLIAGVVSVAVFIGVLIVIKLRR